MNRTKMIVTIFWAVLIGISVEEVHAQPYGIPVQIQVQFDTLWCWAACSTSVLNRYGKYPGVEVELGDDDHVGQCMLANKSRSDASGDCCLDAEYCNYVMPNLTGIRNILNAAPYSLNVSSSASTITNTAIASQIQDNMRPIMAGLQWVANPSLPKHMVLIVGSDTSGENIIIMDPANATYYQITSAELRTSWGGWRWIETITMNANAPPNVYLRYTSDHTPYKYYAEAGNIEAGPDFKLWYNSLQPGDTELRVPTDKKITLKKGFSVAEGRKFRAYRGP